MRDEASLEQWRELYDITIEIKNMKPWEHLWDMDTITIMLPGIGPILCSIMGRNGEFYGIGLYIGDEAIDNFYKIAEIGHNYPPRQLIRFQEDSCIMVYFGDREHLSNKEYKLIKELGYKFRGRNNWIYFHYYEKGYFPYLLNEDEVLLAIDILKNLKMALIAYLEQGLQVDFEDGMTLLREYDPKSKLWLSFEAPVYFPESNIVEIEIIDKALIKNLNKEKQTLQIWEMDIAHADLHFTDEAFEKPIYGKFCIIVDKETGLIIESRVLSPFNDDIQEALDAVVSNIIEFKRPSKIQVRDELLYMYLVDLCEKTNIELEMNYNLDGIDEFIEELDEIF